jgi:molybdopterin-guanine dinucleotide biosynthesis protein A
VLACDMPFITTELIEALLRETTESGCCVIPVHHGFMEPLAALYHQKIIPEMELALKENRPSLFRLFQSSGPVFLNVEQLLIEDPLLFSNLNAKDDLEMLSFGRM